MLRQVILLYLFCNSLLARDVRENRFLVDAGGGLPYLMGIEASYRLFPSWHVGLSYGLIPGGGGISPDFSFPSQNVALANQQFVTFEKPTVSTTLSSTCPFIRFYPSPSNFYFQLTVALLKATNNFSSQILDVSGNLITDASYAGIITVTQMLPTLSIGHIFASKLFYFNVNMGFTIAATAEIESTITSELPDRLGGNEANTDVLDDLKSRAQSGIDAGLQIFREEILFLPSIYLAVGFMF